MGFCGNWSGDSLFLGVSHLNLDAKGRLVMPTRYRQKIKDASEGRVVMTTDPESCLLLYTLNEWEVVEAKLAKLPSFNRQTRKLQRLLLGHATELEMDGSGRLLVAPPLREFANMDKNVVLIGQGNKFEIWDDGAWSKNISEWKEEGLDLKDVPSELGDFSL